VHIEFIIVLCIKPPRVDYSDTRESLVSVHIGQWLDNQILFDLYTSLDDVDSYNERRLPNDRIMDFSSP